MNLKPPETCTDEIIQTELTFRWSVSSLQSYLKVGLIEINLLTFPF